MRRVVQVVVVGNTRRQRREMVWPKIKTDGLPAVRDRRQACALFNRPRKGTMTAAAVSPPPSRDPSSLSNPDEARVTHLSWDAVVDFGKRRFLANARYDVIIGSFPVLRLDSSGLDVQRVTVDGKPATFSMSVPDPKRPHLGSGLEIDLGGGGGGASVVNSDNDSDGRVVSVSIQYATSPDASASQWLPPSQTAGKKHPYVFSACFVSMIFPAPRRPVKALRSPNSYIPPPPPPPPPPPAASHPLSAMPGHTRAQHTAVSGLPRGQVYVRCPRHRPALGHGRHVGHIQG
jgi:hypothetical protein